MKPDAVRRNLSGKILAHFEDAGLKIVAVKFMNAPRELLEKHYPSSAEYLASIGQKSMDGLIAQGKNPKDYYGSTDPIEIGKAVIERLMSYMTSGPIFPIVLEGNEAIRIVRKLVGATGPADAEPGSIRGRYSIDSIPLSVEEKRACTNLLHASGNADEAKFEIDLWFGKI
jgi:nucleoside-diphosphate kinase